MGLIAIEDMEFYAFHGCFQEEQIIGTRFLVSLWLETDTIKAEQSDALTETVNYQKVYKTITGVMKEKSNLLEHVARRIIDAVMDEFQEIADITVKISKLNPPMGGKIGKVSVTLNHHND